MSTLKAMLPLYAQRGDRVLTRCYEAQMSALIGAIHARIDDSQTCAIVGGLPEWGGCRKLRKKHSADGRQPA